MQARGLAERLRVWVDVETSANVELRVDGAAFEVSSVRADGGQRFELVVGPEAKEVHVVGIEPAWPEPYRLALEWEPLPEILVRAKSSGERPTSQLVASVVEALPDHHGVDRLALLDWLRRALDDAGRGRRAFARAKQEVALARTLGRWRRVAEAVSVLVDHELGANDIAAARAWVEGLEGEADAVPDAKIYALYSTGLVAMAAGDSVEALRALARTRRLAERYGRPKLLVAVIGQLAVALGELGRSAEARSMVEQGAEVVRALESTCRARAESIGSLGWAGLTASPEQDELELLGLWFQEALDAWEHECPNPGEALNQRINLTLVALAAGDIEVAHDHVRELRSRPLPKSYEPWVAEVEARVGLASGRWDGVPSVLLKPERANELGLDYSAEVRRAHLLTQLGLTAAAIDVFAAAERMLDEATTSVGIGAGTEMFLADRSQSAHGLVRRLVEHGRRSEALCRARLARGRALRRIDRTARIANLSATERLAWDRGATAFLATRAAIAGESRDDWQLSADELSHQRARRAERMEAAVAVLERALSTPAMAQGVVSCEGLAPIAPGEALLLIARDDDGTLVFVADEHDVAVVVAPSVAGLDPATWAAAAFDPVADRLRAADRIRVVADDLGPDYSLLRLPVGDQQLLDLAPLAHTLDLPTRAPPPRQATRALVVSDPSGDLPLARAEGVAVDKALAAADWTVDHQVGRQAERDRVLERLGAASLFHYAGHGVQRGLGGWDAALELKDAELGVTDLLAAPRVPRWVVLAGCETGSRSDGAWAGGINLGRAFVLAGSAQVVVTDGRIRDAFAGRVAEALAREVAGAPSPDLVAGLHRVQRMLRDEDPTAPWWRLRVLVP